MPLRKQLKQGAKALKAHKRQRRESEEASRHKWELTVGLEIHAQLNTQSKLFSSRWTLLWVNKMALTMNANQVPRRHLPIFPIPMLPSSTWPFRAVNPFVYTAFMTPEDPRC